MRAQYSKAHVNRFFCYRCLHGCVAKKGELTREQCSTLLKHEKYCKTLAPQKITYPENEKMSFKNLRKMVKAPIVSYADFEAVLKPRVECDTATGLDPSAAKKRKKERRQTFYQEHQAISYFTKFASIDPNFKLEEDETFTFPQRETYVGEDAAEHFLDFMTAAANRIHDQIIQPVKPMRFTAEDKASYNSATECHICQKRYASLRKIMHAHKPGDDFSKCSACKINTTLDSMTFTKAIHHVHNKNQKEKDCTECKNNARSKVRDHCHVLSDFRGASHQACNLQYNVKASTWKLPCFLHCMRNYDGHMLIRALKPRHGKVRIIPTNFEKYLAIQVGRVLFLDSYQFALKGLEELVGTMTDDDFPITKTEFDCKNDGTTWAHCHAVDDDVDACEWCKVNLEEERFQQLRQKGIFFYDYFNSVERLKETALPKREHFFNRLNDEECSERNYAHAKRVWSVQKCTTLRDYHDIYLRTDVALLADFFEKFRTTCMESYGVDAAQYFSTPGMAWDCALKFSGVELELIDNDEMYSFFESSIEVVFPKYHCDMLQQTFRRWKRMIHQNLELTFCLLTPTICTVKQCLTQCRWVDSAG